MNISYKLKREGNGRVLEHSFSTVRAAQQLIGQALYDNGYASKPDAQRFAATVKPNGVPLVYEPYIFILTKENQ